MDTETAVRVHGLVNELNRLRELKVEVEKGELFVRNQDFTSKPITGIYKDIVLSQIDYEISNVTNAINDIKWNDYGCLHI